MDIYIYIKNQKSKNQNMYRFRCFLKAGNPNQINDMCHAGISDKHMDMAMGADLVPVRMSPAELMAARQALRDQVPQLLQCLL